MIECGFQNTNAQILSLKVINASLNKKSFYHRQNFSIHHSLISIVILKLNLSQKYKNDDGLENCIEKFLTHHNGKRHFYSSINFKLLN